MDAEKKKRLENAGWVVGDSRDFLGLTEAEAAYIDMKVALARALRDGREARGMTQLQVAELVGSSQSRVAKMEAADESVSMDLLIRTLLRLGASEKDLARIIGRKSAAVV